MQPAATVAVIIVAYKSRNEIGDCLASLPPRLSGRPVEVILVDNSSREDDITDIVSRFSHVRYISTTENMGYGRANNYGYSQLSLSAGYVLFLNPDTVCDEAALAHCLSRIEGDETVGLISPKLTLANGRMDLACRRSIPTLWDGFCRASGLAAAFSNVKWFSRYNLTYLPENGTYDVGAINGAFMMGRKAVFDAVARSSKRELEAESLPLIAASEAKAVESSELRLKGGRQPPVLSAYGLSRKAASAPPPHVFDERFFMYGDDLDLCIRVKKAGWRIVYDGSVQITHLKGLSVAKDYDAMSRAIFDANRDVYLKHFNPNESRLVAWKYKIAFGVWKKVAHLRAGLRGHRKVRPL